MFRVTTSMKLATAACVLNAVIPVIVQAAETSPVGVSRLPSPDSTSNSFGKIRAQGDVNYEYTQYFSAISDRPELNQSQLMRAELKADFETTSTQSRVDVSAGRYLDIHNSFLSVQELYVSAFPNRPVEVTVGRRLENWSTVDEDWQLGLWQPQAYNVDRIRPLSQGLTGLFVEGRAGDWNFLAYGSPIFIPTANPDVAEKKGDIVSETRWGSTTTPSGQVLDRETRFVYTLSIPQIEKLIGHAGGGARIRYGANKGFFASANYAYKPINSLSFQVDYNLVISDSRRADIEIVPVVSYHHLYGADAGWRFEKSRVSFSFLRDEPVPENPSNDSDASGNPTTDWVRQNPGSLSLYAFHAGTDFDIKSLSNPLKIDFDYLKADEGETRDRDSNGTDRGTVISPFRLDFTNAAMIKATVTSRAGGQPLATSLRYLRDFEQNGSMVSLVEEYIPAREWAVRIGVDIIGVDDDSSSNTSLRFLNTFRANDRIYGGLSYVF